VSEASYDALLSLERQVLNVTEPVAGVLNGLSLSRDDYRVIMEKVEESARAALAAREEPPLATDKTAIEAAAKTLRGIYPNEFADHFYFHKQAKGIIDAYLIAAREDTERPDARKMREALETIANYDGADWDVDGVCGLAADVLRDTERPDKPNLDDAARIIRGLLYGEGDDGEERPQYEVEKEAAQFLSGRMRRDTEQERER